MDRRIRLAAVGVVVALACLSLYFTAGSRAADREAGRKQQREAAQQRDVAQKTEVAQKREAARNLEVAQKEEKPDNVAKFMRAKLAASQSVLEGLVTEDFDKIKPAAEKMIVMSKATEWQVIQGPVYAQYSAEFRRSCEQLIKMSNDKNLDGAALSYMHLTMTCISCHKHVHSTKIAAGEEVPPALPTAVPDFGRLTE